MSRERWQQLDEKATPGPWSAQEESGGLGLREGWWDDESRAFDVEASGVWVAVDGDGMGAMSKANADFIAAARTAWPAAERECDQLRALLRRIHAVAAHAGLPLGQRIHALIASSGLLDDEGQQP